MVLNYSLSEVVVVSVVCCSVVCCSVVQVIIINHEFYQGPKLSKRPQKLIMIIATQVLVCLHYRP